MAHVTAAASSRTADPWRFAAMPGNPLTDPNWAPDLADTVERVVGTVREGATTPVVHAAGPSCSACSPRSSASPAVVLL